MNKTVQTDMQPGHNAMLLLPETLSWHFNFFENGFQAMFSRNEGGADGWINEQLIANYTWQKDDQLPLGDYPVDCRKRIEQECERWIEYPTIHYPQICDLQFQPRSGGLRKPWVSTQGAVLSPRRIKNQLDC